MESYQSVYDGKELDQVNADVAFEEYETIIDKLKNSIAYKLKLELRETLADKAELTAIESENIKREGKGFIWSRDQFIAIKIKLWYDFPENLIRFQNSTKVHE